MKSITVIFPWPEKVWDGSLQWRHLAVIVFKLHERVAAILGAQPH